MADGKSVILFDFFYEKLRFSDIPENIGLQLVEAQHDEFWPKFSYWLGTKQPSPGSPIDWRSATAPFTNKIVSDPGASDYIRGCQVLDFNFVPNDHRLRHVWVRAEYIRAFKAIEKYEAENPISPTVFILTGQPGTGKTWANLYYLPYRRRLQNKLTIIVGSRDCAYFPSPSGHLFSMPLKKVQEFIGAYKKWALRHNLEHVPSIWVAVDSDYTEGKFPGEFALNDKWATIIFSTSPDPGRYKHVRKTLMGCSTITLNPWTAWEMSIMGALHGLEWTIISDRMSKYGPVPRNCYDLFIEDGVEVYEQEVRIAVNKLTPDQLVELTSMSLSDLTISHKLTLVYRCDREPVDHQAALGRNRPTRVEPISERITSLLLNKLRQRGQSEILNLFNQLRGLAPASGFTGVLFEAYCLQYLENQSQQTVQFWPMTSSGRANAAYRVEDSAVAQSISLFAHQSEMFETLPDKFRTGTLYCPFSKNEPGIDAFIFHDPVTYLLQITLGKTHDIKVPAKSRLQSLLLSQDTVVFLFLIPKNHRSTFTCPGRVEQVLGAKVTIGVVEMPIS